MIGAAAMLTATSCSDWDDYNEVKSDAVNPSADLTLWENISQNAELSKFAAIIKKVGFDDELHSAHAYTVWAPLNGTYDDQALLQADNKEVLYQFVKNHIAEYNHAATGAFSKRIRSLNLKSHIFEGSSAGYTYSGMKIQKANLPSVNGTMHILAQEAPFLPNVYEYIQEQNGEDSIANHFHKYEYTYLDEERSVVGPIVDGRQTYIDSVMVTENTLLRFLNAGLEEEDSSYLFLYPTNNAWNKTYDKMKSYYKYINTLKSQDLANSTSNSDIQTLQVSSFDTGYMTDSLVKRNIIRNLAYSYNDTYNAFLQTNQVGATDSLRTTTHNKLSNPEEILKATTSTHEMSNGKVYFMDSLEFHPWETFAPMITASAINHRARILTGSSHVVRVDDPDSTKVDFSQINGDLRYAWVEPTSNYSKPELDIFLPNVLSTTYNIYLVIVPANISLADSAAETKPNQINVKLNYCNEKGALADIDLGTYTNDTTKVDTLFIGQHTFPVCYAGLDNYYPNIKITSPFSVFNKTLMETYTRDLRIAAIILKPVEMEEYEKGGN